MRLALRRPVLPNGDRLKGRQEH